MAFVIPTVMALSFTAFFIYFGVTTTAFEVITSLEGDLPQIRVPVTNL